MKSGKLITGSVLAVIALAFMTTTAVYANPNSNGSGPNSLIVKKISQKFNLKESEVKAVFDAVHKEREAEFAKRQTANLEKLVAEGKITAVQKDLIIAKWKELRENRQNKAGIKENLKSWANQNGIDLKYLFPMGMKRHHMMMSNN